MLKNKKSYIYGYDIETMPNLVRTWGKWEQNVIWYERYGYIWSISGAEYVSGKPNKIVHKNITDFPLYKKDKYSDEALVRWIWEQFDKAPAILAHNGDSFDSKMLVSRFVHYGLPAPSPYKQIDTKKLFKRYLREDSNSLDDIIKKHWTQIQKIAKERGIDISNSAGKVNTGGYGLWQGAENGDPKSIRRMKIYNNYDVTGLFLAYFLILPYVTNHPNLNVLNGDNTSCPNCGSHTIQKRGFGLNSKSKYQRLHCQDCSAWFKGENIKCIQKK